MWLVYGFTRAFSSGMERLVSLAGMGFLVVVMLINLVTHFMMVKRIELSEFQMEWIDWGAVTVFIAVLLIVLFITLADPVIRLIRSNSSMRVTWRNGRSGWWRTVPLESTMRLVRQRSSAWAKCSALPPVPGVTAEVRKNFSSGNTRVFPCWRHVYNLPVHQFRLALHLVQVLYCGACFGIHHFSPSPRERCREASIPCHL